MPNVCRRQRGICVCKNDSVGRNNSVRRDVWCIPVAQKQSLTLKYKKTASMCFSIKRKANENSRVKIDEIEIDPVDEFTFLGVILDSHLKFNRHAKKLCKTVKPNLNCFRLIRKYIPLK